MNWTAFTDWLRQAVEALNTGLTTPLFFITGTPVTVTTLLVVVALLLGAGWISRLAQRGLARTARGRGFRDPGTLASAQRLVHYAVLVVAIGVSLETLGVDLTALFAAGAVFAVAVGFATQNILQNFVSGVILLVERTITPSDVLEVEGEMVRIEEMRTRSTIARTLDDEQIIIPNSVLVQSNVKNYTLQDSFWRIRCQVGVAYGSDLDQVKEVLCTSATSVRARSQEKEPVVLLMEFGDSAVSFDVSVWTNDPWAGRSTRSDLNFAIWDGLKAAGVTIAFPQLDLHVKPGHVPPVE